LSTRNNPAMYYVHFSINCRNMDVKNLPTNRDFLDASESRVDFYGIDLYEYHHEGRGRMRGNNRSIETCI
jgi:hypothetical protein